MGDAVANQIERALTCFANHDASGARAIIDRDTDVNLDIELDIELEETTLRLLALHQPDAIDLRLITAAMKITTELERSAIAWSTSVRR